MSDNPNPQGKGLVPVLDDLAASRPRVAVPAKRIDQITRELFTSLFVLESEFGFRPVVGRSYWLYRRDARFRLSLVAPDEWAAEAAFGRVVGECVLQPDLTWTLALADSAADDTKLLQLIEIRRRALEDALHQSDSVEGALPVYRAALPFHQRVFAAGLAHSLRGSLQLGGLAGLSYRQALALLPETTAEAAGDSDEQKAR